MTNRSLVTVLAGIAGIVLAACGAGDDDRGATGGSPLPGTTLPPVEPDTAVPEVPGRPTDYDPSLPVGSASSAEPTKVENRSNVSSPVGAVCWALTEVVVMPGLRLGLVDAQEDLAAGAIEAPADGLSADDIIDAPETTPFESLDAAIAVLADREPESVDAEVRSFADKLLGTLEQMRADLGPPRAVTAEEWNAITDRYLGDVESWTGRTEMAVLAEGSSDCA